VKKQYPVISILSALVPLFVALFSQPAHSIAQPNLLPPSSPAPDRGFSLQPSDDIPAIVDQLYLGVPAGNGHGPQRLAVDSQRQRLYTLNNGLAELNEGNTISVIDLATNQVTALIPLDNLPPLDSLQPTPARPSPLDLQLDPYRPRLYALTGDPYADSAFSSLTIIDLDTRRIVDTLPGVLAIAPGPDRLYLTSATRLWAADPTTLTELAATNLQLSTSNLQPFLLFNAKANRLYLGHKQPATLTAFAADTLAPVGTYSGPAQLMDAVVDETSGRVWLIDSDETQLTLRALDPDGRPQTTPAPYVLTDDTYSTSHLALSGSNPIVTNRTIDSDLLQIFNGATLTPVTSLTIPGYPYDLAADPTTGRLFAAYNDPGSYILALDPATGAAETIFTALTISAALADPEAGRLYILNNERTLTALSLTDYNEIERLELEPVLDLKRGTFNVQRSASLSLDPSRQRLYLSGSLPQVIDTVTFKLIATLATPGQLTPDPTTNRLYLTPPCQCRIEQCNTLILNTDTFTGTTMLFPSQDPLVAPCVIGTTLDPQNQLLYTQIYNGIAGSNSGDTFSVFDVAGPPQLLYSDGQISYDPPALDLERQRAFMSRYRLDRSFIHRFDRQGQTISPTLELAGASGTLTYDPPTDRLYAVTGSALRVFDGDLALLSEITLPGLFKPLTLDSPTQRLYLTDANATLLIIAASGGQLDAPSQSSTLNLQPLPPQGGSTVPPQLFPAPGGDYFRLDHGRLYRADGETWQPLGRGLPDRTVQTVAISPNYQVDHTLLVGLAAQDDRTGGLFRSTDAGDTWQPTTRGLTDLEISQIVFSPTFAQDQTIFLTTAYRGLFRSTNGGDTWQALAGRYAGEPGEALLHLAVSPNFAQDKLVLISSRTLLRSTDGGETWLDTGLPPGQVAFSPNFARDKLVLSDGRWRSADGGQTWQPAAAGLEPNQGVQSLFFSPNFAADQTVYLLLSQNFDQPLRLQRSINAGRAWQSLLGGLPANFNLAAATILPSGELYLSDRTGQQPFVVEPQDLTWGRPAIDLARLDLQDMVVSPGGGIFVANSVAGLFRSANGGQTWANTNFPARADETKITRLAMAANGTLFAAAGTIIERSQDGGSTWTYLANLPAGFEVTALAVSPNFAGDGVVLAGGNYVTKQLLRSGDRGQTWQTVYEGSTVEGASDMGAIAFSPNFATDKTAYAWLQYGGLLRSTDSGQTWTLVPNDKSGQVAQTLAVTAAGRLYLGTLYGGLYVSDDGGQSWLDLSANIPDERTWSSALTFGPNNSLFLGTDVGIYRSPDGGQNWSRANNGLPVDPDLNTLPGVRALVFSGQRLYAALIKGGLFVSENQGQSWRSAASN
jgi:photosystem II stability/assembly factor-like uncharacterized protein/DNA-binding beta-propeller fold protein YncE